MFKRSEQLTLKDERKTRSPVAVKCLFDEALSQILTSMWPCTVEHAVHLAGLLMQIRFGDYDPTRHKHGFLADGLETFVPMHLLHNQLKTSEWERRIYEAHGTHRGKTDVQLLHRLFLQYCWQWPFYGASFFDCELQKLVKRAIGPQRNEVARIGISSEWLTVIFVESNTLKVRTSRNYH